MLYLHYVLSPAPGSAPGAAARCCPARCRPRQGSSTQGSSQEEVSSRQPVAGSSGGGGWTTPCSDGWQQWQRRRQRCVRSSGSGSRRGYGSQVQQQQWGPERQGFAARPCAVPSCLVVCLIGGLGFCPGAEATAAGFCTHPLWGLAAAAGCVSAVGGLPIFGGAEHAVD